jgi:hypothetical protein
MTAKNYQKSVFQALTKHFKEIKVEWDVARGATDPLRHGATYAPRLDIAVGPFNKGVEDAVIKQRIIRSFERDPVVRKIIEKNASIRFNDNPRCVLAIEIEFSGSSKHILGDFTNASMMGLVGLVIVPPSKFEKASRIYRYIEFIRVVDKAPADLFRNLVLFKTDEFLELLK